MPKVPGGGFKLASLSCMFHVLVNTSVACRSSTSEFGDCLAPCECTEPALPTGRECIADPWGSVHRDSEKMGQCRPLTM